MAKPPYSKRKGYTMAVNFDLLLQLVQEYLDDWYEDEAVVVEHSCRCTYCLVAPDILQNLQPSFSETLINFIKKQGLTDPECYTRANIDRKLFSKIKKQPEYHPKKTTVFALIFGLRLNLQDAETLLESAGYSLSHSIKMDVIIEYMIQNKIYDINLVNDILFEFDCELLGLKS